uniref:Eukaryotic peptide chain release translation termination factor 1 n=1 Tax=Borely moumouvirus TaxID=2712067 RepID=A0A6G6AC06_9VIRU
MYDTYDDHAILLVSGKKTLFYLHNNNNTKLLKTINEVLPNQHKTGGQSAVRFERIRNEKIQVYVKKIIEYMIQYYTCNGKFKYTNIIIAGPAEIKNMIIEHDIFCSVFKKNLSKTLTIPEINDNSIYKIIEICGDIFDSKINNENNSLEYFENIIQNPEKINLLVFGDDQVENYYFCGKLKEIYICHEYINIKQILDYNTKTKINIIKSQNFTNKYGNLVGIKYYDDNSDY